MRDISPSTISNDVTDEVLTEDMVDSGVFDLSMMADMPLDGMDAREFATLVAETASAFLPPGADPNEFVRRYVTMTVPLLRFGGFERLTAGLTLGGLVDKNPWIGVLICSAATVLGLWVCWPKGNHGLAHGDQQGTDEMGGEPYA